MIASLRIATRGSQLALWQAGWVRELLAARGVRAEALIIETQGDRERAPFAQLQGQGFFTKAVQDAVLDGRADLAVHSLKDLPTAATPGLSLAAIPRRGDARDALVIHPARYAPEAGMLPVPAGTLIGTSASRRRAQVQALRPDLELRELRGNVPTRVRKVQTGEYGAAVLAGAGLERLNLDLGELRLVALNPRVFTPAPGQGALAVECRAADGRALALLAGLDDSNTRAAVQAERGLMARLDGGCQLALGALATFDPPRLNLLAWFAGRTFEVHADTPEAAASLAYSELKQSGVLE